MPDAWAAEPAPAPAGEISAPRRAGSPHERRGRVRGPMVLPGPLTPRTAELRPTRRDRFDALVLATVDSLTARVGEALDSVEFGTEDVPHLSDEWSEPVPLGSLVPASADLPARVVLFRRPIEMRARTEAERALVVREQLVEHVAALLGRDPSEFDD